METSNHLKSPIISPKRNGNINLFRRDFSTIFIPPSTRNERVITNRFNIEPAYREKLEKQTVVHYEGTITLIVENPKKPNSFHEIVSRMERELMEFKQRVWDKDLAGARRELLDLIQKANRELLLSDYITTID